MRIGALTALFALVANCILTKYFLFLIAQSFTIMNTKPSHSCFCSLQKLLLVFILLLASPVLSNAQDTLVLQPDVDEGKDALIRSRDPDEPAFNSQSFYAAAWTYGGEFGITRGLIRFNLEELPPQATILEAKLDLFYDYSSGHEGHAGDNAAYIFRITEEWLDWGVTWNKQPNYTMQNAVYLHKSNYTNEDYTNINVTQLVKDCLYEPEGNQGFMIKLLSENEYNCLLFASSNHPNASMHPRLSIIYETCDPPQAAFTYSLDYKLAHFTDASDSAISWLWNFGDGYLSQNQNCYHEYESYGLYQVCLTVENACGFATVCDSVPVCLSPEPMFSFHSEDQLIYFTDSSLNADEYFWDFGDGHFANTPDPVHYYADTGIYIVCLTTSNPCSSVTYCDTVSIQNTGIGKHEIGESILLSPNPSRDFVNIKFPEELQVSSAAIQVHDMSGKPFIDIHETAVLASKIRLDLSLLPPGSYLVSVTVKKQIIRKILLVL